MSKVMLLLVSAEYPYNAEPPMKAAFEAIALHLKAYGFTNVILSADNLPALQEAVKGLEG